jgi:hypothetical protein
VLHVLTKNLIFSHIKPNHFQIAPKKIREFLIPEKRLTSEPPQKSEN